MERLFSLSLSFLSFLSSCKIQITRIALGLIGILAVSLPTHAIDYLVTLTTDNPVAGGFTSVTAGELRYALTQANLGSGNRVVFNLGSGGGTVTLTKALPAITQSMDITTNFPAANLTINANNTGSIFFVYGTPAGAAPSYTPTPIAVNILGGTSGSLTLQNGVAQGGTGGGGGMGAGGALFINQAMIVNLTNVNFSGNQAIGGDGTNGAFAGGGGLLNGNGGIGNEGPAIGGGGGGVSGLGGSTISNNGVEGLIINAASGGNSSNGGLGGINAGGGGGGGASSRRGAGGGVGGMDGGTDEHPLPGEGGFGGGGGGGVAGTSGAIGGYGGGGGSGQNIGGAGGFGGGGGYGISGGGAGGTDGGAPALGGGDGDTTTGGGGAGFGGAIFAGGTEDGGVASTLTISSTQDQAFSNSFVQSGAGANNGSRGGADLFIGAGVTVQFQSPAGVTQTVNGNPLVAGITGQGSISQQGAGDLVINSANNYSGGTLLGTGNPSTSGFITVGSNMAIGTGLLTLSGGTLRSNTTASITNSIMLTAPSFIGGAQNLTIVLPDISSLGANLLTVNNTANTITIGGIGTLSGTGGVTKTGAGTLVYATMPKTYTGLTTIQAGTLQASVVNMLPTTNALAMTGGTFSLVTFDQTLGIFSGTAGTVNLGTATFTVGSNNSNFTFGGSIIGTGSLTKTSNGTFTLTGASTYSGNTNLTGGRIAADNNTALGTSTLFFSNGSTLLTNVGVTLGNAFTVNASQGTLGGTQNLTLNGAGTLNGLLSITNSALTTLNGVISGPNAINANLSSGTLLLTASNGYAGGNTLTNGTIIVGNNNALGINVTPFGLVLNADSFLQSNGAYTINNGFIVGAAGSTINGSHDLGILGTGILNGTLSVTNSGITTLAGNISGPGSIVANTGSGTLSLLGNNSYSGGTTLTSGYVNVNTNTALGTGLLTFNGGTLLNSAVVSLANPFTVTSAGGVIAGPQNITLSGNGGLSGALVNINGNTTTLSGNLIGGGSITQTSGLMVLTGTNSYTGGTVVTGGVLQGNTNSLQGNILNDASVVFDQNFTGTYAGMMSGTGTLTKQNTGTLILTGPNTYSGGTTVTAGVLQGNTSSVQGNILNNASVVFDQNINGAYTGVMSGTGTVTKQGTGILTLTNNNLYTGLTTVNAGALLVDGSLADSVTVNSGGILGGRGSIAGAVINNSGGTVSPGDQSIGTLTVGSFLNNPGATLGIQLNGTQTALLQVTPGLATITGSTVSFTPQLDAYYSGTTYTFLASSTGVVGQFSTVNFTNNNLGPFQTQVIYNPNSVQLRILSPFNPQLPCLTPNQSNVAQYLSTLPFQAGTDLGAVLTILAGLDPCGANGPFEQISSAETAATYWVLADDIAQTHLVNTRRLDILRHFKKTRKRCEQEKTKDYAQTNGVVYSGYAAGDLWPKKITRKQRMQKRILEKKKEQEQVCTQIEQHLDKQFKEKATIISKITKGNFLDACGLPEGDAWARGFGSQFQQNKLSNSRAYNSKNNGFLLGMDYDICDEWFFGFSAGKVFSHLDWKGNPDKAHLNTALGSVYASWYNDSGFYLDSSLVAGDSNYALSRNLKFGTLNRYASSHYRGFSISPYGGAGYVFDINDTSDAEVFGNVEYIDIRRNAYNEKGAGSLNLAVRHKQVGFLRSEAGIGLSKLIETDIVSVLVKTKLSYVNKRQTQKGTLIAGLVGFPGNFAVTSYTQPKHQAALGIGVYSQFCTSGFWSVFYDAECGSKAMMHAGSARIGFLF